MSQQEIDSKRIHSNSNLKNKKRRVPVGDHEYSNAGYTGMSDVAGNHTLVDVYKTPQPRGNQKFQNINQI